MKLLIKRSPAKAAWWIVLNTNDAIIQVCDTKKQAEQVKAELMESDVWQAIAEAS